MTDNQKIISLINQSFHNYDVYTELEKNNIPVETNPVGYSRLGQFSSEVADKVKAELGNAEFIEKLKTMPNVLYTLFLNSSREAKI